MNEQLLRKSDANALSSRKKKNNSEKPYGGSNPHPLYLRGLMHFTVY